MAHIPRDQLLHTIHRFRQRVLVISGTVHHPATTVTCVLSFTKKYCETCEGFGDAKIHARIRVSKKNKTITHADKLSAIESLPPSISDRVIARVCVTGVERGADDLVESNG